MTADLHPKAAGASAAASAPRLAEQIRPGQTVICASARLARRICHEHAQYQQRQGRRAWESPDVLSWSAWLRRCLALCPAPATGVLLTQAQEVWLWRETIEATTGAGALLQTESVARQAARSWQCARQHLIPVFPPAARLNEDAHAFKDWADAYQTRCREQGWIDQASLPETLGRQSAAVRAALGKRLVLAGFDRHTPQQEQLWRALQASGTRIERAAEPARKATVEVMTFADADAEIRAAAQWARRCVEADAEATAGILTPDLRALRRRIRYIFEDELAPGHLCASTDRAPWPFSISMGEPLIDYPLVRIAFSILDMTPAALPVEPLSALLRSPFISVWQEEISGRALLDERLRACARPELGWDEVLRLADRMVKNSPQVTRITAMLRAARRWLDKQPARQTPAAWVAGFNELLEIFGWPGTRALNSAEYQQADAWQSALDELIVMQQVAPRMTRHQALSQLRSSAAELNFQPETGETPIQVMDPHGAAAMGFDHIRMLGLSEEAWPPRRRPEPFIPLALQREYGVPEAAPDRFLQHYEQLQAGLVGACPEVVLSYARSAADQPLLGSPLLPGCAAPASEQQSAVAPYWRTIFVGGGQAGEKLSDVTAPPVVGPHRGGTGLLRDQSQCPFRAFARHRLHAREPADVDLGPDAMQRGQLLHSLLQNAWSHLQDSRTLASLSAEQLAQFAHSQAQTLVDEVRRRDPLTFTQGFAALEVERLARRLQEWLKLELSRAMPFRVVGTEQQATYRIGDLEFATRLDRVDVLEDGCHVIIDYKTGRARVGSWAGERPDEPQLPLYATHYPEAVAAVAFALLRPGAEMCYQGLARSQGLLPGVKAFAEDSSKKAFMAEEVDDLDWSALFDRWRAVLQALASEFLQGVATVTPKPRACEWCEQHPFCRIHELSGARAPQPDE